jgi:glutamate N-acetyltransferase/amino-acid N-acetyltransferase
LKLKFTVVEGSIVAPRGFQAAGVFCDIKRIGTGKGSEKGQKRDLALIYSEVPCVAAGLFTTNQVRAAPVTVCLRHIAGGVAQAIVVNSGNANACTGRKGLRDAEMMARQTAAALRIPPEHAMVGSTGRIGVPLPMGNVRAGIRDAVRALGATPEHAAHATEAIMTSDTRPKQIAVEINLAGATVRIGGICKGAGMIQPGMSASGARPPARPGHGHATMLAFLTTDAAIGRNDLQRALEEAVALSFNRITVDGDMSTNDTVLLLANGGAHGEVGRKGRRADLRVFQAALNHVCLELARMIVRDGEGVHRVVTVRVEGARSGAEADAAARAVANSALVKTSWHGGDPNWGRVLDALGYSTARVVEGRVDIGYSEPGSRKVLWSLRRGQPTRAPFKDLCAAVAPVEFDLHIRLNLGGGRAAIYGADLTEAYVDFNKGNIADPASLGG